MGSNILQRSARAIESHSSKGIFIKFPSFLNEC
jgi:hypothetical protein